MKHAIKKSLFVFIYLAIFICSACTYTPWHEEQSEVFLNKGIAYIQAGLYTNALKELLEAEKYNSRNPKIHYYLAMSYHGKNMNDKAIEELQLAISLGKNYSEAHNYLGALYSDRGFWDKAIEEFQKALKNPLYETPEMALFNMGWAYYSKKDYKEALTKYQETLRTDRFARLRPQVEKNIGLIYFDQQDFPTAIIHFRKSVELNPNFVDSYFLLGESYLKINDKTNARKAFQAVVNLAPQSSLGQKARAYLQALK
jgi:type IV pilus assembly protein PilF